MTRITTDAIRASLDGVVPGMIATCSADGTPNVTNVSQVHYVDSEHVALSFQFFNKTRENILANPYAEVNVVHPHTGVRYGLSLQYLRTEDAGPLFESMKAKLAGIASQTGMSSVFRLLGADIYRVLEIERIASIELPLPLPHHNPVAAARAVSQHMVSDLELEALLDQTLHDLDTRFGIDHAMILLLDEAGDHLYTVASHGYSASGVGSEIALGEGIIGVAASHRTPIRINHRAAEYAYHKLIHATSQAAPVTPPREIPFPGLAEPHSQMAVPILAGCRLIGVLYVESEEDLRFGYDDEDALVIIANQLGATILLQQLVPEALAADEDDPAADSEPSLGTQLTIRHYPIDDSVFINEDYLIKGVAGAIFWKLVCTYIQHGRTEFTNRELRLDPTLGLPDIGDNLEARLILLQRRLTERDRAVCIEKTGRGRFRLNIEHPVQVVEMVPEAG